MPTLAKLRADVRSGAHDGVLSRLYDDPAPARERILGLADDFEREFGTDGELSLFSAPGRTEIGGNHTDHNRGRVLAGAVNMDIIGLARPSEKPLIRLKSRGFPFNEVPLSDLVPREECSSSNSLIRGLCAGFKRLGRPVGGFEAVTTTDVLSGSGLSSSAAFENLVGTAIDHLFGDGSLAPEALAKLGQYAENVYLKKPSGLMDQTASAFGGLVTIDFGDEKPAVRPVKYDFSRSGHALCITGPIGSHADLTAEYAAVPTEMKAVAAELGASCLREADEAEFWRRLPELYRKMPHRALLRAAHFYADDARVPQQVAALESGDFPAFLSLVNASGRSSFMYLQNVVAPDGQGLALALALSEQALGSRGAFRVHGGGFAGTIQAFVPRDLADAYAARMDAVFGRGACRRLRIRPEGALKIL